jgi:hypothetical protein
LGESKIFIDGERLIPVNKIELGAKIHSIKTP